MTNAMLASALSWGERFSLGGQMMAIGLGAVFSVLALLWGCLELMHFFIYTLPQKKKAATPAPAAPAPVPVPDTASGEDEDEIVAVIAAAVYVAESQTPGSRFRAVSFKRIR